MIAETQATLDRNEQVIILLNRRGFSSTVLCRSCVRKDRVRELRDRDADITSPCSALTSTHPGDRLEYHYRGFRRTVPKKCPKCEREHLYYLGAGSQQGEERLQEVFPNARSGRMGRDPVRGRGAVERLHHAAAAPARVNLLVGTPDDQPRGTTHFTASRWSA